MIPRKSTLLLLKDNPDDVDLVRRAFARAELMNDIIIARDDEEALDYLFATGAHAGRDSAASPRVVLVNLKLPKVDGLDVLRRIRSHEFTNHVAVVVLTTSSEDRDILSSYDLGANSYIRKPVDFTRFVDAVRHLDLYWLGLNEPPPKALATS